MASVYLPSLSHWEFGNFWSGSKGKEMLVELWDQDVCRELAEITETKTFPVTQEGLDAMRAFLEEV